MRDLRHIFVQNSIWARRKLNLDPHYFSKLSRPQTPKILWIGCSDSRVSADVFCGFEPGEAFVHRNVGNIVHAMDMNCMSALQYAVEELRVEHIIICGHYGCGAVHAALHKECSGLIGHWLEPIRDLARAHDEALGVLSDADGRRDRLCELNVRMQVKNIVHSPIVQKAWSHGASLRVHGWIYGLADGLLRDLCCSHGDDRQRHHGVELFASR